MKRVSVGSWLAAICAVLVLAAGAGCPGFTDTDTGGATGVGGTFFPFSCTPTPMQSVPINPVVQTGANWCWAASLEMITTAESAPRDQCAVAKSILNKPGCCDANGTPLAGCDVVRLLSRQDVTSVGLQMVASSPRVNSPLSFDEIREYIGCRRSPIAVSWVAGSKGHMEVASAYDTTSRSVYLTDPNAWETGWWSYAQYQKPSWATAHWNDYFGFSR